jgi:hypothetical protein
MIIETSSSQLYKVREVADPNLPHVWLGFPVKRESYVENDEIKIRFVPKGAPVERLIRKLECKVIVP